MKKSVRLMFLICLWIVIAGFLVSCFYKNMVYGRQYDMAEQAVLSTYRKQHTNTGIVKTEAHLLESNMMLFAEMIQSVRLPFRRQQPYKLHRHTIQERENFCLKTKQGKSQKPYRYHRHKQR